MGEYSLNEKVEFVRLVGDGTRSFREAAVEFNRRHPGRNVHHRTIAKINQLFNETGNLEKKSSREIVCTPMRELSWIISMQIRHQVLEELL